LQRSPPCLISSHAGSSERAKVSGPQRALSNHLDSIGSFPVDVCSKNRREERELHPASLSEVIAAAIRGGIEIGSIDIQPFKITIHSREKTASEITDCDIWKMSQSQDTRRVRHSVKEADAMPRKPRSQGRPSVYNGRIG
jgi:hypothetical protein